MEVYKKREVSYDNAYKKFRKYYQWIGATRIAVFLSIVYLFYLTVSRASFDYLYFAGGLVIVFLLLLQLHAKYSWKMRYLQGLKELNTKEIAFLVKDERPFDGGVEFITTEHPYAFDLDIFGEKSLFQYLNRTASYIGKLRLAAFLKKSLDVSAIVNNQEAIKELSEKVDWRQEIFAYSYLSNLDKTAYERLKGWSNQAFKPLSKVSLMLAYILPIALVISFICYLVDTSSVFWGYAVSTLFSVNLIVTMSKVRLIQVELGGADKIHETIQSYAEIINRLERENFHSKKMQDILLTLKQDNFHASKELKKLSQLFEKLETVGNLLIMILFNGIGQYHIHVLYRLLEWKKSKRALLMSCIEIVGEVEALNSLANFAYNNKDYCYPRLRSAEEIYFTSLGHPLLAKEKRVCNTISFSDQRFVILTGSNMSGKSTFLRTIGVNLVLAGAGAPVCATQASFYPMPLFVSMRLTDSLDDSESYFYAEVKRLKMIIEEVKRQPCFVLLDEILRGTNSDDKQSGTIGVISKLIKENTYGVIATHDLEVCETTLLYPTILTNKCFEVEIKGDDLFFDYKIRDGVCQNKNATFIMKKMGIIA